MIRGKLFKEMRFFDEKFIMYCEDTDLCLRIREWGYNIYFIPRAEITHYRGWAGRSMESLNYYFSSHRYYYQKNFTGIYKKMLLFLNRFEWFYEKIFFKAKLLLKSKKT
ncbi:MAG: hypothetical protein K8S14_03175 [Actinomycetia bacterium]|nr:hypothetical protein [Actinomycetes bacterium]